MLRLRTAPHGPIKISSYYCRRFCVGQLAYPAVAADGFTWAHWHMLRLSMPSHGPISFPTGVANCFVWAHVKLSAAAAAYANGFALAHRCMQLLLPKRSHRPIGICCSCRCLLMCPLVSQQVLPIASFGAMRNYWQQQLHMPMGPHEAISNSSRIFQWAHRNKWPLLLMVSCGPIGICCCCCCCC